MGSGPGPVPCHAYRRSWRIEQICFEEQGGVRSKALPRITRTPSTIYLSCPSVSHWVVCSGHRLDLWDKGHRIATVPKGRKDRRGRFNSSDARPEGLGNRGGNSVANLHVSIVDVNCQLAHPGCRGEGNQSNHKRVLDQVLTVFVHQDLQHHGQLQEFIFHLSLSPFWCFLFRPQSGLTQKVQAEGHSGHVGNSL